MNASIRSIKRHDAIDTTIFLCQHHGREKRKRGERERERERLAISLLLMVVITPHGKIT